MTPLDEDGPAVPDVSADGAADVARLRELRAIIDGMSPEGREIIAGLLRDKTASERAAPTTDRRRTFGLLAGQFSIGPEFFEPLSEEELRAWGEI